MEFDNCTLSNLRKAADMLNGKAAYFFNADRFMRNFTDLQSCFRKVYSNTRIAYSYKTNYTPEICRLVKELGGYAEVVSDMEYAIAKDVVKEDERKIIYNGLLREGLYRALDHGAMVNVESFESLKRAIDIAKQIEEKHGKEHRPSIGIRVAIDEESRFGFVKEEFMSVLATCTEAGQRIAGIHCHASGDRGLVRWMDKAQKVIQIAKKAEQLLGYELKYIDLGGHLYGRMDPALSKQFDVWLPGFEDYAKHIGFLFDQAFGSRKNPPELIMEPGTALVADTVSIIATVENVRWRKDKLYATLNISSGDCGLIADCKNVPIFNVDRANDDCLNKEYAVYGYTCMEQDFVSKHYKGRLMPGDRVLVQNVGAYSISRKDHFILPPLAMYKVDDRFEIIEKIRRAGNVNDAVTGYEIGGVQCNLLLF